MDPRWKRIVESIEARGVMPKRIPSLDRVHLALSQMSHTFPNGQWAATAESTVVVAGTNGKGSVCATLSRLFVESHRRVGFYSSPHLVDLTERIRINDVPISRDQFCHAYESLEVLFNELDLSHFECLTLMAHWVFRSGECGAPVDIEILEVGMGGVWDATNAIPHRYCGIATLAFDHEKWLGTTLPQIALNKLGIIPAGISARVVHLPWADEAREVVDAVALQTGAHFDVAYAGEGCVAFPKTTWLAPWGESIPLALMGERALLNTGLAVKLFEVMGGDARAVVSHALPRVNWPGRLSCWSPGSTAELGMQCPVYLSGDHNPSGVESLTQILETIDPSRIKHLWVMAGFGEERNLSGMGGAFEDLIARVESMGIQVTFVLTEIPYLPRRIGQYAALETRAAASFADWRDGLGWIAERAQPKDLCIVTGSLYLVGDLLAQRRA